MADLMEWRVFKLPGLELAAGGSIPLTLLISELLFLVFVIFCFLFNGCETGKEGIMKIKLIIEMISYILKISSVAGCLLT